MNRANRRKALTSMVFMRRVRVIVLRNWRKTLSLILRFVHKLLFRVCDSIDHGAVSHMRQCVRLHAHDPRFFRVFGPLRTTCVFATC